MAILQMHKKYKKIQEASKLQHYRIYSNTTDRYVNSRDLRNKNSHETYLLFWTGHIHCSFKASSTNPTKCRINNASYWGNILTSKNSVTANSPRKLSLCEQPMYYNHLIHLDYLDHYNHLDHTSLHI